jgi:hypothetical protein
MEASGELNEARLDLRERQPIVLRSVKGAALAMCGFYGAEPPLCSVGKVSSTLADPPSMASISRPTCAAVSVDAPKTGSRSSPARIIGSNTPEVVNSRRIPLNVLTEP